MDRKKNEIFSLLCDEYNYLEQSDVDSISSKFDEFLYDEMGQSAILFSTDIIDIRSEHGRAENFDKLQYLLIAYSWLDAYINYYKIPVYLKIERRILINRETEFITNDAKSIKIVIYKIDKKEVK